MSLADNQLARRGEQDLELRPTPLRLRWRLDDLVTADGHRLQAVFSCSVRALGAATEQRMLAETFLHAAPAVTAEAVIEHFLPAYTAAATALTNAQPAAYWLNETAKPALIDALRHSGQRIAFSSGLELLPPFHLELNSPSFQQQKLEAMQRTLAEQRAASQTEQVQRAVGLLKEFQSLQQSMPQLSPSRLMEHIAPADQGQLLQTLLLAGAENAGAQDLWLVAGPHLFKLDESTQTPALSPLAVPTTLGPLRSVQGATVEGQRRLLLGAQMGVLLVDPADPAQAVVYPDPGLTSALGFNRVVALGDRLWASHGEAGIVAWKIDELAAPALTIRPAQLPQATRRVGPRNLQPLDDRALVFSLANQLVKLDTSGGLAPLPTDNDSDILALLPSPTGMIVVYEDGWIIQLDPATLAPLSRQRRAGRLTAAALLPWLTGSRLLLATEDGPVLCLSLEDPLLTQYLSPHRGLRVLTASSRHLAALSPDRQRLVLWHPWETRHPTAELNLLPLARHRAADVEAG